MTSHMMCDDTYYLSKKKHSMIDYARIPTTILQCLPNLVRGRPLLVSDVITLMNEVLENWEPGRKFVAAEVAREFGVRLTSSKKLKNKQTRNRIVRIRCYVHWGSHVHLLHYHGTERVSKFKPLLQAENPLYQKF